MLIAIVDETGHESKDVVILAGFLGTEEQWAKCEQDWRAGLGSRDHLHMSRLRWSKVDRVRKLLGTLGAIPHAAGLQAIYSAVKISDYDDLVDGTQMQKLMKGYFITLLGIIDIVAKNIAPDETFKLVLEAQNEYALGANQIYLGTQDYRTPDGRRKLVSLEFIEKGDSTLAEPADFLAFALLQLYRDAKSVKSELCAPILRNTRDALERNHVKQPDLLRQFVTGMVAKYPNLMRSVTNMQ
jgi:hypothetical protein